MNNTYEYRVCCECLGDEEPDFYKFLSSRSEAIKERVELEEQHAAEKNSYDRYYIERRTIGPWERI